MGKFLARNVIAGHSQMLGIKKVQLSIPNAKQYAVHAVKNGEDVLHEETLLEGACSRKTSEVHHIWPYVSCSLVGGGQVPRTLQHILSKSQYPLSQGPVLLPNDCFSSEKYEFEPPAPKSVSEVLTSKTVFSHGVSQACYEWHPTNTGVSAWGAGCEVRAMVGDGLSLAGPASVMGTMGVVYTCMMSQCVIFCPCTICTDTRKTCKNLCKAEVCKECNSQCLEEEHIIKLPRTFSAKTDHYTIVTNMMTKYKHVYPYAGIPLSCASCTRDVEEHNMLHMVWHARCRFCKFHSRYHEQHSVVTLEDYKYAEKIVKNAEGRTCSFCLFKCHDCFGRKRHEDTVHKKKAGKYGCDKCEKSFSNKNALKYHVDHHMELKVTCDLCGFQSSSKGNLEMHKKIHIAETKLECDGCNKKFTNKQNLMRHEKEVHYGRNVNVNFIEDLDDAKYIIKCEYCDLKFKRNSDLKRHVTSIHSSSRSFQCLSCEKAFSRKDTLARHMKSIHTEEK